MLKFTFDTHKADIYTLLKDMCNAGYLKTEGHCRVRNITSLREATPEVISEAICHVNCQRK